MATMIQDDKGMNHNRAMAALALGRIGVASPEVGAALVRGWKAPDAWVRQNAAEAVELLARGLTNELPQLLDGLWETNNAALERKLMAIGKMGPPAHDALPTLRELTQASRVRTLVADPEGKIVGRSVDDLCVAAKMAICRIAPEEGRPFLRDIADKVGYAWDPVQFLVEPGAWSNEVVRVVEPLLVASVEAARSPARQTIVAYIVLSHDRQHSGALEVLHRNKSAGELRDRLLAGRFLFETLGETNGLCALVEEGFKSPESYIGQNAGNLAAEMGNAALPCVPAFKVALWHPDQFVRASAGRLILKLAPQELPINEGGRSK
jgi:hypothetical protein